MLERFCAWLRKRRGPERNPALDVPKEVRDADHNLKNAVQRAKYHIQRAEAELHPIEKMIEGMRK